jgi:hypothetical protein
LRSEFPRNCRQVDHESNTVKIRHGRNRCWENRPPLKPGRFAFPDPAALLRRAGRILIEPHDEWDGADRRYFGEHSMTLLKVSEEEVAIPELAAA